MVSLSCGHHYHKICCIRSNDREPPQHGHFDEPGLGCSKLSPMNDDPHELGLICLLCFEGIRVAAAIEGDEAKRLLEAEYELAIDDDDTEPHNDVQEDDLSVWSAERCQEEIDWAICKMRNIASTIPLL